MTRATFAMPTCLRSAGNGRAAFALIAAIVACLSVFACAGCGEDEAEKKPAEDDATSETASGIDVDFAGAGSDVVAVEPKDVGGTPKPDSSSGLDSKPGADSKAAVDAGSVVDAGSGSTVDTKTQSKDSGGASSTDTGPPPDIPPTKHIKRVVIAGDSWSTGLIQPLRDAMDARGFKAVQLSSAFTANAGSQAAAWVANQHPPKASGGVDTTKPKMLDALKESLDNPPLAELLVLVIGANDYNRECADGYGTSTSAQQKAAMDTIEKDIGNLVDEAIAKRPNLQVVIVGYDYFHFDYLTKFGLKLPGHTLKSYNEGLVELDKRRLAIAAKRTNVHFANNLGILQHTYGDKVHATHPIPNLSAQPAYKPGAAPKPGWAPAYKPMPGGFTTYPAPLDHMPDGLHPTTKAFRTIIDHTLDQGMEALLLKGKWPK